MPRTLSSAERLDWLQLARSGGVGPRTFQKLLQRFGSARRAFEELPRLAREAGMRRSAGGAAGATRPRPSSRRWHSSAAR